MLDLVSLNIERSRHLERVADFLRRRRPDVACLQELSAGDIGHLQSASGLHHAHYVAMAVHPADGKPFGVGILSRTPFVSTGHAMYGGTGDGTLAFDRSTPESRLESCRYVAVQARVAVEGQDLDIATTHFPWTPDGGDRPFQWDCAARLIGALRGVPLVLCGDFNAPRGGAIFGEFAKTWRDCIPPHVTTSLDPVLHRAGPLQLMVDGLFLSPHYQAANVGLHAGVSDHQAVSATITRAATA